MGHPRDEIYDFSIANICSTSCATEINYFVDIKTWNDLKKYSPWWSNSSNRILQINWISQMCIASNLKSNNLDLWQRHLKSMTHLSTGVTVMQEGCAPFRNELRMVKIQIQILNLKWIWTTVENNAELQFKFECTEVKLHCISIKRNWHQFDLNCVRLTALFVSLRFYRP